jgi:long-subunit acyl-CoA synthetase (AMP-forming)
VFTAVPRLLEKIYDSILAKGEALTGIKKKLFYHSLKLGERIRRAWQKRVVPLESEADAQAGVQQMARGVGRRSAVRGQREQCGAVALGWRGSSTRRASR